MIPPKVATVPRIIRTMPMMKRTRFDEDRPMQKITRERRIRTREERRRRLRGEREDTGKSSGTMTREETGKRKVPCAKGKLYTRIMMATKP